MRNTNRKKRIRNKEKVPRKIIAIRAILLLLIIAWALIVFNLSGQNGEESSGLSRKVVELFIKNEELADKVEPYIRKFAHFSEYGLGGVLFLSLFYTYNKWTDEKKMIVSILLGIWYASMDEIHQLMVPARHGSIVDVYIDTLGFSTGVCVMLLLIKMTIRGRLLKDNFVHKETVVKKRN